MSLFSLFSQNIAKESFIFLDTETTGFYPLEGDRVIEIAMIKTKNGEVIDQYEALFNPGMHIPEQASKVNNITDEMVSDKPFITNETAQEIIKFIDKDVIVAHNAAFDLGFLSAEFAKVGVTFEDWTSIDTLKIANHLFPGQRGRLESLINRYNIKLDIDLHRALNDTIMLKNVFFEMIDEAEIRNSNLETIVTKFGFKGNILPRTFPAVVREALIEKSKLSGKYKKRNGEIIDMTFTPLAPVWINKKWFLMAISDADNAIVSLYCSHFEDLIKVI